MRFIGNPFMSSPSDVAQGDAEPEHRPSTPACRPALGVNGVYGR